MRKINLKTILFAIILLIFGLGIRNIMAQEPASENIAQSVEGSHENRFVKIWQSLPPEERQALKDNYRRFKDLPEDQRQKIKEMLLRYKELSPEQKQRIRSNFKKFRDLSVDQRKNMFQKLERWKNLSDEQKQSILSNHRRIKEMPPEERQRFLENLNRQQSLPIKDKISQEKLNSAGVSGHDGRKRGDVPYSRPQREIQKRR